MEIWHVGRASSDAVLDGKQTVSSSNITIKGPAVEGTDYASHPPRPPGISEVQGILDNFFAGEERKCIEIGIDGVEIHSPSTNSYLPEYPFHDKINTRTDAYGGSIEERSCFILENTKAVTQPSALTEPGSVYRPITTTKTRQTPTQARTGLTSASRSLPYQTRTHAYYVHMMKPSFYEELSEQDEMEAPAAYSKTGVDYAINANAFINSPVPYQRILAKGAINFLAAAGNLHRDNAEPKPANEMRMLSRWGGGLL
ncbi:12-oxophytodienoate reductase 1 [Diplocarpon rosae]|nr:12-oxophytodienoate reductase 1 [Diplocarpon rosae]